MSQLTFLSAEPPCQDFSVAGLRAGLAGPRGGLTLEFAHAARRLRPRWLAWENVPGVLSIDGGRAFGAFLRLLGECGYGVAYRILDAQYFGVPQRRRRVFVIGYLGNWRPAAAVLFEPESLRGDPAPRRETGKGIAPTIASRTTGGGGLGTDFDCDGGLIAPPLDASYGRLQGASGQDFESETFVAHALRGEGFDAGEDDTGRGTPIVFNAQMSAPDYIDDDLSGTIQAKNPRAIAFSSKDHGADAGEISPTLRAMHEVDGNANGGGQVAVAFDTTQISSPKNYSQPRPGDPCHPLATGAHPPAIAYTLHRADKTVSTATETNIAGSVRTKPPGSIENSSTTAVMQGAVRRLTPRECERLQGFPDDYTLVPYRKKPAADGPRYKALGNSMAVPVMAWLGRRIDLIDKMIEADK